VQCSWLVWTTDHRHWVDAAETMTTMMSGVPDIGPRRAILLVMRTAGAAAAAAAIRPTPESS